MPDRKENQGDKGKGGGKQAAAARVVDRKPVSVRVVAVSPVDSAAVVAVVATANASLNYQQR